MGVGGLTLGLVRHIALGAATHPFLRDHMIAGTPVVPLAMVLEWFASAAAVWRPSPKTVVLRGISALRQISLTGFDDRGDQCSVRTHEVDDMLSLMLVGPKDVPHHRASAPRFPLPVQRHTWSVPRDLRPAERSSPYDGTSLPHGPAFRSITRLPGISPSGAWGTVVGLRELGWPDEGWHLDPAAVDGGLQIAALWAGKALGAPVRAVAIREFRALTTGPIDRPARVLVRRRRIGTSDAECDIGLIGTGDALVELVGVRLVARPEHRRSGR